MQAGAGSTYTTSILSAEDAMGDTAVISDSTSSELREIPTLQAILQAASSFAGPPPQEDRLSQ